MRIWVWIKLLRSPAVVLARYIFLYCARIRCSSTVYSHPFRGLRAVFCTACRAGGISVDMASRRSPRMITMMRPHVLPQIAPHVLPHVAPHVLPHVVPHDELSQFGPH